MNHPGTDPIADAAALAVQGVHELRADNARLTEMATQLDKAYCTAQAELEMTRTALTEAKRERDFYQRFTIELVTQLNNVGAIVGDCIQRSKDAAYRPSEAPPQLATLPEVSIPGFLAQGPAVGGNGRDG